MANIENFIIAAMIDANDKGEVSTKGILQIFNKDTSKGLHVNRNLTPRDIKRIEAMQKLLGAAISRAEIYSTCLTTLLGLGLFLDNSKIIGTKTNIIDDDFIHSLYDIANMVPSLDQVKRHIDFFYPEKDYPVAAAGGSALPTPTNR